jgi:tetratricopeptide (TPR) repeat protein
MKSILSKLVKVGLLYSAFLMACGSNTFMAYYYKGIEQQYYGELEKSLESFNHAIQLNPKCAKCYFMRAKVWEEL